MQLPSSLRAAIEIAAARCSTKDLNDAARALSARYRAPQTLPERFINTDAERLAYAATRMPATYAAACKVFGELQRLIPAASFGSLLDLGGGTGAASWAATETFSALQQCTLLEQDSGMIQLGKELAHASEQAALRAAAWQRANLQHLRDWPPHDLAVFSYALSELEPELAARLVRAVWQTTQQALVIIEPGTMRGFATVSRLRDQLIELGGHLVAPCPHARACPLPETDWCHFAARVERSALQRRLKAGSLGYEDEKFSYVIFAKQAVRPAAARVLRHPQRPPGFTRLQLCAPEGLQEVALTKRAEITWKRARKIAWGDAWE
ncbi:MAG: rRNA methyltransferase [Acidobacteria bacterium]|nr:rRNA methyltransferase [Acidobacteriota bacterium]MBI3424615.1 rRNA methyltransferase [Acidobacteriota bacterium]